MFVKFKWPVVILGIIPQLAFAENFIDPSGVCEKYADAMEEQYDIPDNLLHGIVRTESSSYPWVINWQGRGYFFETKQEAINKVKEINNRGYESIDVGCAQINLYWHKDAFSSLEEAFDPKSNLEYAAKHLNELRFDYGFSSWRSAVGAYHNPSDAERAKRYASVVYRKKDQPLKHIENETYEPSDDDVVADTATYRITISTKSYTPPEGFLKVSDMAGTIGNMRNPPEVDSNPKELGWRATPHEGVEITLPGVDKTPPTYLPPQLNSQIQFQF